MKMISDFCTILSSSFFLRWALSNSCQRLQLRLTVLGLFSTSPHRFLMRTYVKARWHIPPLVVALSILVTMIPTSKSYMCLIFLTVSVTYKPITGILTSKPVTVLCSAEILLSRLSWTLSLVSSVVSGQRLIYLIHIL